MWQLTALSVVLTATIFSLVSGACVDSLSKKNPLNVVDKDGNQVASVKKCKALVKTFPELCAQTSGNVRPNGVPIGGNGGSCCKSCGDPNCLDFLSKRFPYVVFGKVYTSCGSLIKKFPVVCDTEGQKGGRCCRRCKGVSTKCVDSLKLYPVSPTLNQTCPEFIKSDPCRCDNQQYNDDCCQSCQKYDTKKLGCSCRDLLSPDQPARVFVEDLEGNKIVDEIVDSCKDIARYYAGNCDKLGGENQACCKSCQGVDPNCYDNLAWKVTFGGCVDCNCHELRMHGKMTMKRACRQNVKGSNSSHKTQQACCLQCKRVGVQG